MRLFFTSIACIVLLLAPTPCASQYEPAFDTREITFSKDEVHRILLDAGATTASVLDSYPADYEFTEEEVRELLRSIPQDELLEEYKKRKSAVAGEQVTGIAPKPSKKPRPEGAPPVFDEETVRPFGYDVFSQSPLEYAPTEDIPVGPDYVLGPGDELVVTLWGGVEKYYEPAINREGNITLPELGVIQAAGSTLGSFEEALKLRFSGVYSGFNMDVSVGKLRTIQVFVVGDVVRPGAYTISSVSTAFNALYYAGGPTPRGSLRRVLVYRTGERVSEVDLYEFLLHGDNGADVRLRSGDTVFVTPIGQTATMNGAVKRPAIYELAGGEAVEDLIDLAGGFTAEAYTKRVDIKRIHPDSGLTSVVIECPSGAGNDSLGCFNDVLVSDGDEMTVYSVWHVHPKEFVSIGGMVQFPGRQALFPGMTVSDLVFRAGGLLDQAYLLRAEISRIEEDPETSGFVSDLIFIDLQAALRVPGSEQDVVLERGDKVFVRKIPGWRAQHLVAMEGEVRFPGIYTLRKKEERLSYLIERAGGLTAEAFPSAGSVHRKNEGRVIVDFARALEHPGGRDDLTLVDGDSVHIPVYPNTIAVEGAIGRPGSILFRPGKKAGFYIERTGGFLEQANKGNVRILRVDGSTEKARKRLWFDPTVEPGNRIVVELREPSPGINWTSTIKDATTIVASLATTVFIITRIEK